MKQEGGRSTRQLRYRKHRMDDQAKLGLKTTSKTLRSSLEEVNLRGNRAGAGEKRVPLFGQHRNTAATLEEPYTYLPFQIGQCLAHHRLGASQAPARC